MGPGLSGYLEQSQKQKMVLNAVMQQSLMVLQMPTLELRSMIENELISNPILELQPEQTEAYSEFTDQPLSLEEMMGEQQNKNEQEETTEQIWFGSQETWQVRGVRPVSMDFIPRDEGENFYDMLLEQLGGMKLKADFASLCRYIVGCLNKQGYFEFDCSDIAYETGWDLFNVTQALYTVQSLSPVGVGARTLQECLMLQLTESEHFGQHTIKLVKEGLPLLAEKDIPRLAKLLKADDQTTREACAAVLALNPIPSRGYTTGEKTYYIVPDAFVHKVGAGYQVVLNNSALPPMEICRESVALLQQHNEPDVKRYLQGHLANAQSLKRAVQERGRTLALVLERIIAMQPEYFACGQNLQPMTLLTIASELGLHVSTISRAVQGKYIVCAAGTVHLKTLFTQGSRTSDGKVISVSFVRQQLKKCIDAENPQKPLSDENIRLALQAMNIDISRRTVAKYRGEMDIPSTQKRKK